MKRQVYFGFAYCLMMFLLSAISEAAPIPVLFDTDIMGDVDDVGSVGRSLPVDRVAAVRGSNPAKRSYFLYNRFKGRASWDQTAVLYAARGLDGGLKDVWNLSEPGRLYVDDAGDNEWKSEAEGPHQYLIEKMPPKEVAAMIEELMLVGSEKAE